MEYSPSEKWLRKLSQFPPIEYSIEKETEAYLGEHIDYYKKALACESHGYGIAANVYYRRIVESLIGKLLEDIGDFIEDINMPAYRQALEQVTEGKSASDRIKLVKELLPKSLRPSGANPLGTLYESLSQAVHTLDDEESLSESEGIRIVLLSLIKTIASHKSSEVEYQKAITQLQKRNDKNRSK